MINKSNLFVSPLLTDHSLKYTNDNYISEQVFPIVKVKKDTGQIATYGMDNLRIANSIRAQGSSTNEVNHTVTIGAHYILVEHALKELVTAEEMENADSPINPKIDAVENLMDRMWVIKEKALADTLSNTAVISQNVTLAGGDQWSDYVNSAPIVDISTGINQVRAGSGKKPNTLIFAYNVWIKLLQHPDFVARAEGSVTVTAAVVEKILMQAFPHIKNIWIGDAQYNSGKEGGTSALADIWDKVCVIAYIEPSPTPKSRSLGYTYQKTASRVVDESGPGQNGEAWDRKGVFVRVTDKYDQKLVDEKCAYLIKAAVA